jgi:hypothetical protein
MPLDIFEPQYVRSRPFLVVQTLRHPELPPIQVTDKIIKKDQSSVILLPRVTLCCAEYYVPAMVCSKIVCVLCVHFIV